MCSWDGVVARVRHWSCPDTSLLQAAATDPPSAAVFCREAEDVFVRPLAAWEEHVLRGREERISRRLQRIQLVQISRRRLAGLFDPTVPEAAAVQPASNESQLLRELPTTTQSISPGCRPIDSPEPSTSTWNQETPLKTSIAAACRPLPSTAAADRCSWQRSTSSRHCRSNVTSPECYVRCRRMSACWLSCSRLPLASANYDNVEQQQRHLPDDRGGGKTTSGLPPSASSQCSYPCNLSSVDCSLPSACTAPASGTRARMPLTTASTSLSCRASDLPDWRSQPSPSRDLRDATSRHSPALLDNLSSQDAATTAVTLTNIAAAATESPQPLMPLPATYPPSSVKSRISTTCSAAARLPTAQYFFGGSGSSWLRWLLVSIMLLATCSSATAQQQQQQETLVCVADININHKTDPRSLDKYRNCTVLEGFIQINSALKEYQHAEPVNFSFPNLVEITDYLLLYRANQFENLTHILPKLAVIRGHRLVHNYALAIYQMKNLRTVGLLSLTNIINGGVRIEKNPSLCSVETVNWKKIVMDETHRKHHIFIEENMDRRSCSDSCPNHCADHCWDQEHCQIKLVKCPGGTEGSAGQAECYTDGAGQVQVPCSSECLGGCTVQNSPEHCLACRNVWFRKGTDNNTVCVEKCPDTTLSYKNWKCITESACAQKLQVPPNEINGDPKVDQVFKIHNVSKHNQQCVDECPANFQAVQNSITNRWECKECTNCPRHCDAGAVVNSRFEAEKYRHCTHINGDLEIRISEGDITPVLEEAMKDIKVISGTLKISRSFALVSFYFFKSLTEIQGRNQFGQVPPDTFVITIMENENLVKLFPQQVRVGGGKAFIHYNQKLCMEEINKFIEASTLAQPKDFEVSSVTNGNKAVCSKERLEFKILNILDSMIYYSMGNYHKNLHERGNEDVNALIGYEIYYREISEEQFKSRNVSKFEGLNACSGNTWHIEDRRPQAKAKAENLRLIFPNEIGFLTNLEPYTPYALYAGTLMVPHLATAATGAQSEMVFFRTATKPPEEVRDLRWEAVSYSSLQVSWQPPARPHGLIDHYVVVLDYIALTELRERNYCSNNDKFLIDTPSSSKAKDKEKKPSPPALNTSDACPTCSCSLDDDKYKITDNAEEHIDEQNFYNHLLDKIFTIPISKNEIVRRSVRDQLTDSGNSVGGGDSGTGSPPPTTAAPEPDYVLVNIEVAGRRSSDKFYDTTTKIPGRDVYSEVYKKVAGETNEIVIDKLKHFALYQVKVMACQAERPEDPACTNGSRCRMQKDCSSWALAEAKTKPKPNADDLDMADYDNKLKIRTANETTGETYISWRPPRDPNEMIVKYTLEDATTLEQRDQNRKRCIPLSALVELEDGWVEYKLPDIGEYWIRLQAVSLHGSSAWTSWQWAQVHSNATNTWIIVVVVLLLLIAAAVGAAFFFRRYKKKNQGETEWEIVSRNPEYHVTGYTMDGWEVARDLIEKGIELGSGSFGVCHRGVYKHPEKGNIDVAIKTVPDHATFRQRVEFLNEASVMKEINTAHVVKLLGVVSQGQPTLVLMELMENGDLRKYLRSLRPDNQNKIGPPPDLQRILQMALEIADGMAYLSVRKYVHRDLAARNCMVSADFVVKVGDFGMAQDVYEREYYRTDGRRLLPVRWMAPESLRDGRFTSKSDVWGYGVVLWEMATLAEQPYQGWCNDEVVRLVKDGNVMQKPDDCPDILYDMMKECWARNPDNRPSFIDLCEKLLPEATEHFLANSFYTSSQGSEAVANQNAQRRALEEAMDVDNTPLNTNGGMNSDNGHAGDSGNGNGGENVPMREVGSSTHVTFSTAPDRGNKSRNKLSLNGIGFGPRNRNKSGSNSGEA